jgi:hypothetical protein
MKQRPPLKLSKEASLSPKSAQRNSRTETFLCGRPNTPCRPFAGWIMDRCVLVSVWPLSNRPFLSIFKPAVIKEHYCIVYAETIDNRHHDRRQSNREVFRVRGGEQGKVNYHQGERAVSELTFIIRFATFCSRRSFAPSVLHRAE